MWVRLCFRSACAAFGGYRAWRVSPRVLEVEAADVFDIFCGLKKMLSIDCVRVFLFAGTKDQPVDYVCVCNSVLCESVHVLRACCVNGMCRIFEERKKMP